MRICWNDWFNGPIRDFKVEDAKTLADWGIPVVGINSGDNDPTDADIDRAKKILADHGLQPGPYGSGCNIFHPDPAMRRRYREQMTDALITAGKFGCTGVRYSVGSMHPVNVWMHHPENHTQKALDMVIEATRPLVTVAEDNGVMLCPETTQWTIVGTIERMREYVDRLDSRYARVIFDPVNHMAYDRIYDSGRWMREAIAYLGDRIGEIHVKDVKVDDKVLVSHIDEDLMGRGVLDHAALIEASDQLEPWKTFSLEHIYTREGVKTAFDHIQGVAKSIGHTWTDPALTHEKWLASR